MDYNKSFMKTFDKLTNSHNPHRVFEDFVELCACSISNRVDHSNYNDRENRYLEILKDYNPEDSELFKELFSIVADALTENLEQDFLGAIFMDLNLGIQNLGQCFTPYDLAAMNAEMLISGEDLNKRPIRFMDPAAGAGVMIIAMANEFKKKGVNYQNDVYFLATDLDRTAAFMCYIQMSLLGCPGTVTIGNSLTEETFSVWYTPMLLNEVWDSRRKIAAVMNCFNGTDFIKEAKTRPAIKTLSDF